jgi:hypothetical protein
LVAIGVVLAAIVSALVGLDNPRDASLEFSAASAFAATLEFIGVPAFAAALVRDAVPELAGLSAPPAAPLDAVLDLAGLSALPAAPLDAVLEFAGASALPAVLLELAAEISAFAPGNACAWGPVRNKEVAIALLAIRTICRRFRISEVARTAGTHQLLRPTYLGT